MTAFEIALLVLMLPSAAFGALLALLLAACLVSELRGGGHGK